MNVRTLPIPHYGNDNNGSGDGFNGPNYSLEYPEKWQDVRAYLFKSCASYQREILDAGAITCFFDVDGGTLPAWRCDILAQILEALFVESCRKSTARARDGRITVSLRHKGQTWIFAVMDEGVREFNHVPTMGQNSLVLSLALMLKGTCRTRLTADGAVTVIVFHTVPHWDSVTEPTTLVAGP